MFNLFENMISINLREVTPSRPIPLGPEHAGTMVRLCNNSMVNLTFERQHSG